MIKILHCITDLSPDGAQRTLLRLTTALSRIGFENRVISLMSGGHLVERFEEAGISVLQLGMKRGLPGPRTLMRLTREITDFEPDVIQGWMYHGNVAASVGTYLAGSKAPVAWNIRRGLYEAHRDKLLTRGVIRLGAAISRGADAIIYCVEIAAKQHEAIGFSPSRRIIIPNGFDTDRFAPEHGDRQGVRREFGLSSSSFLVGIVGRYHHQKDYPTFLRAAKLVADRIPNVHFLMAGRNVCPNNREAMTLIKELGLQEQVHLLGERHDIPRLVSSLDLFVSSSENEGFSNVVGEAMASGVPVVATDAGASRELLEDLCDVVPRGAPSLLAEAMVRSLRLPRSSTMEIKRAVRERIVSRYSLDSMIRRYAELYRELIPEPLAVADLRHAA